LPYYLLEARRGLEDVRCTTVNLARHNVGGVTEETSKENFVADLNDVKKLFVNLTEENKALQYSITSIKEEIKDLKRVKYLSVFHSLTLRQYQITKLGWKIQGITKTIMVSIALV
jgi:hypothetical protein